MTMMKTLLKIGGIEKNTASVKQMKYLEHTWFFSFDFPFNAAFQNRKTLLIASEHIYYMND